MATTRTRRLATARRQIADRAPVNRRVPTTTQWEEIQAWAVRKATLRRKRLARAGRFPCLRTLPPGVRRPPIPSLIRKLVWLRDNGRCCNCGSGRQTQLDHIIAWSFEGPDESANLRVLCAICNNWRSNFKIWVEPAVPVAAACDDCLVNHPIRHGSVRLPLSAGCLVCTKRLVVTLLVKPVRVWCGTCRRYGAASFAEQIL